MIQETLAASRIFRGLDEARLRRVADAAEVRVLEHGEHPFELGQPAEWFYIVLTGGVDLCVPISIGGGLHEVSLERKGAGSALGWSAFVRPHRYRLTARADGRTELIAMGRGSMIDILAPERSLEYDFMERIAELSAQRLLTLQALWVRELQRRVGAEHASGVEP